MHQNWIDEQKRRFSFRTFNEYRYLLDSYIDQNGEKKKQKQKENTFIKVE